MIGVSLRALRGFKELLWRVLRSVRLVVVGFVLAAISPGAHGQTDEIQVYDAEIAEPGVFNLMVHTNFTSIGRTSPNFQCDRRKRFGQWRGGVGVWREAAV
jgi:hypothetical protein